MDISTIGTVVAIVVITYLIGLAAKQIPKVKDSLIPVIVGVAGGILGVIGMFVMPDYPAKLNDAPFLAGHSSSGCFNSLID